MKRPRKQRLSRKKLGEAILYISKACQDHPTFDMEKLKTILFLSDLSYYRNHLRSITGATYYRESA